MFLLFASDFRPIYDLNDNVIGFVFVLFSTELHISDMHIHSYGNLIAFA